MYKYIHIYIYLEIYANICIQIREPYPYSKDGVAVESPSQAMMPRYSMIGTVAANGADETNLPDRNCCDVMDNNLWSNKWRCWWLCQVGRNLSMRR